MYFYQYTEPSVLTVVVALLPTGTYWPPPSPPMKFILALPLANTGQTAGCYSALQREDASCVPVTMDAALALIPELCRRRGSGLWGWLWLPPSHPAALTGHGEITTCHMESSRRLQIMQHLN